MKKTVNLLLAAFVFCGMFASDLFAQESYRLKYNFKKGKTYFFANTIDGNFIQEVMGREMKMAVNSSYHVRVVVDNVKNGTVSLITSLDSGTVVSRNPMKDTTISLTPFAGKRARLVMLEDGTVTNSEIIDSIKMLNLQGISQKYLIRFVKFPSSGVKKGEPWSVSSTDTMDIMGSGKLLNIVNSTFTLVGREKVQGHDCLKMSYTGDVKNSGQAQIMGMSLILEGAGKISGNFFFDPVQGMAIKNESSMDNEMTLAATGQQNMVIPITQSIKISQSLVE